MVEIALADLVRFGRRHLRVLLLTPITTAFLCVGIALLTAPTYSVRSSFVPAGGNAMTSRLMGLAAQFGMSMGAQATESPEYYASLLGSPEVRRRVATANYSVQSGSGGLDRGQLSAILKIEGTDSSEVLDEAIRRLRQLMRISSNNQTGLVSFVVRTKRPDLSEQLAHQVIAAVNALNLSRMQQQADAERRFLENRISESRSDLRRAEDILQNFLQQNRSYQGSPELQFGYERLQREVITRQQVYSTLAQALEQAQIDAARTTPVISVVEAPRTPLVPDRRGLLLKGILALGLGVALALGFGLMRDAAARLPVDLWKA